ncbi:MAG: DUF3135 domain-containing protein [Aeromonas sp.]
MELPDFDTLKDLAVNDPLQLERILQEQVALLLAQTSPDQQRRLRGLQFKIDAQRQLAKNPLDSCMRIADMMWGSFYALRTELNELQQSRCRSDTQRTGNIICLADYRPRK